MKFSVEYQPNQYKYLEIKKENQFSYTIKRQTMLKLEIRTEACKILPIVLFSLLSLNLSFQKAATLSV